MSAEMNARLVIQLFDRVTAPLKKIQAQLDQMGRAASGDGATASTALDRVKKAAEKICAPVEAIKTALDRVKIAAVEDAGVIDGALGGIGHAAEAAELKVRGLHGQLRELHESGAGLLMLGGGAAAGGILDYIFHKTKELDETASFMREAFTTKGSIGPDGKPGKPVLQAGFQDLEKLTSKLGDEFPTTTAKVQEFAGAMGRLGESAQQLVDGRLRAILALHLVADPKHTYDPEQFSVEVLGIMHAHSISNNQTAEAVNLIQKAIFGGLEIKDQYWAEKYLGSTNRILGVTGLDGLKETLIELEALHRAGSSGSHTGVQLKDFYERGAMINETLSRKEMAPIKKMLEDANIRLQFFDNGGKPLQAGEWIKQLQQLDALNQQQVLIAMHKIFGEQGGPMGQLLKSLWENSDFKAARENFDRQPELMDRLEILKGTLENRVMALSGSVDNLMAAIGGSMLDEMKEWATDLNKVAAGIEDVTKDHRELTRGILTGVGTLGVWAAALGVATVAAWALSVWVAALGAPVVAISAAIAGGIWAWENWANIVKNMPQPLKEFSAAMAPSNDAWHRLGDEISRLDLSNLTNLIPGLDALTKSLASDGGAVGGWGEAWGEAVSGLIQPLTAVVNLMAELIRLFNEGPAAPPEWLQRLNGAVDGLIDPRAPKAPTRPTRPVNPGALAPDASQEGTPGYHPMSYTLPGNGKLDAGGTVNINVKSDGSVTATGKPNDTRISYTFSGASTGPVLAGA
jgi:TP901 family phage tail tape measure protein